MLAFGGRPPHCIPHFMGETVSYRPYISCKVCRILIERTAVGIAEDVLESGLRIIPCHCKRNMNHKEEKGLLAWYVKVKYHHCLTNRVNRICKLDSWNV
jgi:hypothetical protein